MVTLPVASAPRSYWRCSPRSSASVDGVAAASLLPHCRSRGSRLPLLTLPVVQQHCPEAGSTGAASSVADRGGSPWWRAARRRRTITSRAPLPGCGHLGSPCSGVCFDAVRDDFNDRRIAPGRERLSTMASVTASRSGAQVDAAMPGVAGEQVISSDTSDADVEGVRQPQVAYPLSWTRPGNSSSSRWCNRFRKMQIRSAPPASSSVRARCAAAPNATAWTTRMMRAISLPDNPAGEPLPSQRSNAR